MNYSEPSSSGKAPSSIVKRLTVRLSFVLLFCFSNIAQSAEVVEVQNLSNRRYLEETVKALQNAKRSIFVAMYHLPLDPSNKSSAVTRLVDSLIEAKRRGVDVDVILDQEIDTERVQRGRSAKNLRAYHYLRDNGILASFDSLSKRTHAKLLVIDGEIVILGSTNWSLEALGQNYEANLLVRSPEIAREITEEFKKIELLRPEKPAEWKDSVRIRRSFLLDQSQGPRLLDEHAERAFRIYFMLLAKQKDGASILIDYEEVAKRLGLSDQMSREAYRRQIIKVLKKLNRDYRLLLFNPRFGKEAEVILIDPAKKSEPLESPKEDYFELPQDFFNAYWLRQLSFRAQYSLLILYDQWSYPRRQPTIEVGLEALEKRYHVSRKTLGLGFQELAREGLLEIYYGKTIDFEKKEFETASYVLLPFYDPKIRESKLRELEALYGKEAFKKAREFSDAFLRGKDPQTIQTLLALMMNYSGGWVELAMKEVILKKELGNPARSLPYLIGILKDWRDKGRPTL